MTQPPDTARKSVLLLLPIMAVAAWLRLRGIGFGLPALNDPDEPLFMMTAIDMLARHSFDPQWFGHPGTTTLYCLAAIIAAVGGLGVVSGRFADADAFAQAVYADPGIVFLPARLFVALCGLACVVLVWRIGRRLGDERVGLTAAALLAVNAVHIAYSQIVRTDMQASVFMLLAVLSSLAIARDGRWRDYLLAGLWVGLACATKWPAALIALCPIGASLGRREGAGRPAGFALAALATLLAVSPFLVIDHATVLQNLGGEARASHPGATGGGFLANLAWYAANPLLGSLGIGCLALATLGCLWGSGDERAWRTAVLPGAFLFLVVLALQALRWERWVVPLIPFLCLAAARALWGLVDLWRQRGVPAWAAPLMLAALAWPMIGAANLRAAERAHDTRQIASAWVRAQVSPDARILVEDAAFDLLRGPWRIAFPLGSAGCVDARALLAGRIRYAEAEGERRGPIVDLAHVDPGKLGSCRADYAILTHFDRYPARSPERLVYDRLVAGGSTLATFRPRPGASSGPVVRIVKLSGAT